MYHLDTLLQTDTIFHAFLIGMEPFRLTYRSRKDPESHTCVHVVLIAECQVLKAEAESAPRGVETHIVASPPPRRVWPCRRDIHVRRPMLDSIPPYKSIQTIRDFPDALHFSSGLRPARTGELSAFLI